MTTFLDALPIGRIVIAGIRDEGSNNMTENAYLALESIGSQYCRDVGFRDSHAIIGMKGAKPGTSLESHVEANGGPAVVELHKADLEVESAGYSDGNFVLLKVDNVSVGTNSRGHNLVVVDEADGTVLDACYFDTWGDDGAADAMAYYINNLPTGRIVLVGIKDEGSAKMNENAYQALESLGSALTRSVGGRDSWALIGVKGATPGTVPEELVPSGTGHALITSAASSIYLAPEYVDGYHYF